MFVTEDKMVKEMQTLSLELAARNNTPTPSPENVINEAKPNEIDFIDEDDSNSDKDIDEKETCIELHKLLKDHLKHDDLQDRLINKLCDIER